MNVIRKKDIITRTNNQGDEKRYYFLFDTFELIITELGPYHKQVPHYHDKILEFYYVIKGTMLAKEGENKVEISEGEALYFEPCKKHHLIENPTKEKLIIATIKTIKSKTSYRNIFKSDKIT